MIEVLNLKSKQQVTLMLRPNNPIIKQKGGLLNLAEELQNFSKACSADCYQR